MKRRWAVTVLMRGDGTLLMERAWRERQAPSHELPSPLGLAYHHPCLRDEQIAGAHRCHIKSAARPLPSIFTRISRQIRRSTISPTSIAAPSHSDHFCNQIKSNQINQDDWRQIRRQGQRQQVQRAIVSISSLSIEISPLDRINHFNHVYFSLLQSRSSFTRVFKLFGATLT